MKPTRCTELVERVYWSCNREAHRHATEEAAAACIARHPNPPAKSGKQWTMGQILEVVAFVDAGESFASIGRRYNLTGGRIQQIYRKGLRYLKR